MPLAFGLLLLSSCADESLAPIAVFDTLEKGAFPRKIALTSSEYDLAKPTTTAVSYEVEFVDQEKGKQVDQYIINTSYKDNHGGGKSKAATVYKTFSQSDFTDSANGFRSIAVNIPLTELLTLFGLTIADVASGDDFVIDTELKLTNGITYSFTNSTAAVVGSAFNSLFRITAKATCPLEDSKFAGNYKMEYVTANTGGFGPIFGATPANVTLATVAGSKTKRAFKAAYLPDSYNFGPFTYTLEFACNKVFLAAVNTGVGCGNGAITIVQGPVTSFDLNNDSVIEFNLVEFDKDGGCGVPKTEHTIRLTKI